jgi:uncharacterized membrane protein YoaK (UPF0700 family)
MLKPDFLHEHGAKIFVALVLSLASGLVDIVGYLGVYHLFTSHLTGTTVQLGHVIARGDWMKAIMAATIVGCFFCGSVLGRALIGIGSRHGIKRIASITLAIETALLTLVAWVRLGVGANQHTALALLAGAMGIQTVTLTGVGPLTVHTTFLTGMVNKLAQLVTRIAFRAYDLRKSRKDPRADPDQRREIEEAVLLLCIWIFYLLGAVGGTWSFIYWGLHALVVAISLLVICLVIDLSNPFALQEEEEQSER